VNEWPGHPEAFCEATAVRRTGRSVRTCTPRITDHLAHGIGDHVAQIRSGFHSALRSRAAGRRVSGIWLARDGCPRSGVRRVYSGVVSCALRGRSSCQMMPAPRKSRPRSPGESGPPWSPAILMRSGICLITVPAGVRQRVPAMPTAATAARSWPGGPAGHQPAQHVLPSQRVEAGQRLVQQQ